MRTDLIVKFCEGVKPKQLIKKKQGGEASDSAGENRTTVYKYYAIYRQMKAMMRKEGFINPLIKALAESGLFK